MRLTGLGISVASIVAVLAFAVPAPALAQPDSPSGRSIVVVQSGVDPGEVARGHGASPVHVYDKVAQGFAAHLSAAQLTSLKADSRVNNVLPDRVYSVAPVAPKPAKPGKPTPTPVPGQTIPTGIDRIDAETASLGGAPVAVAVIDTGVSPHADLNLAGSISFAGGTTADQYGHGTHVAGTIGARDNGFGVKGVAPNVQIYNVRVLGAKGWGYLSDIIAGINWVTANADSLNIRVANMSLSGGGSDTGNCGVTGSTVVDPYHKAICDSTKAGVVYVVAAGNESHDASASTPAAYPEVITVSAIADFDGQPGGRAAATCRADVDDTFADFSNFGSVVDIAAPGVCILSTWKDGGYNTISGTSMATPHVSGAVALLISRGGLSIGPSSDPMAAWNAAMAELTKTSVKQGDVRYFAGDTDGTAEPLLNLGLGK